MPVQLNDFFNLQTRLLRSFVFHEQHGHCTVEVTQKYHPFLLGRIRMTQLIYNRKRQRTKYLDQKLKVLIANVFLWAHGKV